MAWKTLQSVETHVKFVAIKKEGALHKVLPFSDLFKKQFYFCFRQRSLSWLKFGTSCSNLFIALGQPETAVLYALKPLWSCFFSPTVHTNFELFFFNWLFDLDPSVFCFCFFLLQLHGFNFSFIGHFKIFLKVFRSKLLLLILNIDPQQQYFLHCRLHYPIWSTIAHACRYCLLTTALLLVMLFCPHSKNKQTKKNFWLSTSVQQNPSFLDSKTTADID